MVIGLGSHMVGHRGIVGKVGTVVVRVGTTSSYYIEVEHKSGIQILDRQNKDMRTFLILFNFNTIQRQ